MGNAPPAPAGWDAVRHDPGRTRFGVPEWVAAWWVPEVLQLPLWGRWRVPAAEHPEAWIAALGGPGSPPLQVVAVGNQAAVIWNDGFPRARYRKHIAPLVAPLVAPCCAQLTALRPRCAIYDRVGWGRSGAYYAVAQRWYR